MRIILAPDSFKESLSAREACDAIARGIHRARPDAIIEAIPMADGGEGTVDALVSATGGTLRQTTVTGPLGDPVTATWGLLGAAGISAATGRVPGECWVTGRSPQEPRGRQPIEPGPRRTAVIEMAAASGLALVPPDRRNPMLTTTYGTGELIRAAIEAGATRLIIGIGGSATTDGGTGAVQALGYRFLDAAGRPLSGHMTGGKLDALARIAYGGAGVSPASAEEGTKIEPSTVINLEPKEKDSRPLFLVACDVDNPLCGPRGAAAVYGPQKGATPEQVQILDRNLAHLSRVIERDLGKNVSDFPGAGAAGGLGAGLVAFLDARLDRGINLVMEAVRFAERIKGADLVITGEGRLDRQSMMGKVIAGVGRAGKAAGVPVVALVGSVGEGADAALEVLRSFHPINPPCTPLAEALARTPEALATTAAAIFADRV